MTHYNYRLVRLTMEETRIRTTLPDGTSTLDLRFDPQTECVSLPEGSPFQELAYGTEVCWSDAVYVYRRRAMERLRLIEGSRQSRVPRPVLVRYLGSRTFQEAPFRGDSSGFSRRYGLCGGFGVVSVGAGACGETGEYPMRARGQWQGTWTIARLSWPFSI